MLVTRVATSAASRIYLDSVSVTGFRGIGPRVKLDLAPRPGVTLVVGRNGSGKSSLAERSPRGRPVTDVVTLLDI
ncbi:AAA family ATPase [Streptomyces sp. NPDC058092]|uniref:AAA family ATPase n=1 Tax=Streptomyces sp. NPDC058092 TaxID=3346336 RepID=UPI0036E5FFFB